MSIIIVFTGGLVRVTGSGLGCPTWPTCIGGSLPTTPALGIHGLIEFSNRMLAVGMELVGIALVLAIRRIPHPTSWIRLAWVQASLVPLQAVFGGLLVLYGPYREADVPLAPSNAAFDESLKARDPDWGLRALEDVVGVARAAGLALTLRTAMPANNLCLLFRRI